MSEDVSAMIRVGVTVILVAALVAAVLNLMVVATSTMSSGMSTLQSGVSQISLQEFANYNQKKVSGIEVASALSLYSGRDIAICISTNACQKTSPIYFYNYGALLESDTSTGGTGGTGTGSAGSSTAGTTTTPTISVKTTSGEGASTGGSTKGLSRAEGDSNYTAEFKYEGDNGKIKTNNNTKRTKQSGPEYILPSGKFYAELIKNETGEIIGIAFEQQK